jgi:hypothetical protein
VPMGEPRQRALDLSCPGNRRDFQCAMHKRFSAVVPNARYRFRNNP